MIPDEKRRESDEALMIKLRKLYAEKSFLMQEIDRVDNEIDLVLSLMEYNYRR